MVRVPEYEPSVQLRPSNRQGVDVQATPDAFGAAEGRGMQTLAQGLGQFGDGLSKVAALDDVNRAKDADNSYAAWARERMYGDNGFMTLEGRNAVDGRAEFEREAAEKRKEFGADLTGGAAQHYQSASSARMNSILGKSVIHTAQARKQWFGDASNARIATFADDAVAGFSDPKEVQKNIAAGQAELREQGSMHGWDADTLKLKESEFTSGVHSNVALRLAEKDPLAAEKYINSVGDGLSGVDRHNLITKLKAPLLAAKADRNVAGIVGGVPEQSYQTPSDERAAPTAVGTAPAATDAPAASDSLKPVPTRGPVRFDTFAKQALGWRENTDAAAISGFLKNSAGINIDPRVTPWCAAFVNGVLGAQGVKGTGSLAARSFLNFGMATDKPKPGDIVVLSRGGNSSQGHVGFFQGYDENGNVLVLGGNQGNAVSVSSFNSDKVLGFRRAGTVDENVAKLPNYGPAGLDAISKRLASIADPEEREATRKKLHTYYTSQKQLIDARREQTQSWAETQIIQNPAMDLAKIPIDVQTAIGASGMSTLMSYQEKVRSHGEPHTDDHVLYDLQSQYASDPEGFAQTDLFQYRDKLSNADWQKVTGMRQDALKDKRKAREDGLNLTNAFSQATTQLEAVGITTKGKKGAQAEAASKQIAQFNNALSEEMASFKRANDNKAPTQADIQAMTNKLLLPVVIKTPASTLSVLPAWLGGNGTENKRLFEAGARPDNATVDVEVKYQDIPIDLRRGISTDLERELGRKPSQQEITQRYEDFVLNR